VTKTLRTMQNFGKKNEAKIWNHTLVLCPNSLIMNSHYQHNFSKKIHWQLITFICKYINSFSCSIIISLKLIQRQVQINIVAQICIFGVIHTYIIPCVNSFVGLEYYLPVITVKPYIPTEFKCLYL